MGTITDKEMQAKPTGVDQWLMQPFKRGAGVFVGRITPTGERLFYFRYTDSQGRRPFLPIGPYHPKGAGGLTLSDATRRAAELSALYQKGARDLREHLAAEAARAAAEEQRRRQREAEEAAAAALERERRVTIRKLFDRWAEVELKPHTRADGKRVGRKDAGEYTKAQFERRVFGPLGNVEARLVRKSDLLAILDTAKAEGKLRTANMLLADLKQMFRFALAREIVERNPLDTVTKRDVGGSDVERDRVLSPDEIKALAKALPMANLSKRSRIAPWIILATGCRVGELMNAEWSDVDLEGKSWHLPETKNQRPHTIHLSAFALKQFQLLAELRDTETKVGEKPKPWVFPNSQGDGPVCIKSFGKQLSDRQRPEERRMANRAKASEALLLSDGRWTAHDLRRTAATMMAKLGVSTDVIDECLNHIIANRVSRVYVRDRRLEEQAAAFDKLGARLSDLLA
jgi:integrase